MTPEEMIEIINGELGLDGAITHKGDAFKCYTRDIEEGGVSKHYLDAATCRTLSTAFGNLAAELDGSADR